MGMVKYRKGGVSFANQNLNGLLPEQIARLGIAYCPEERGIFASLTVEENLLLPPVVRPGGMPVDEIYALFPNLRGRGSSQGTKLSGGEQQMLAIARILRTGATMLLLDEPTEGLAPTIIQQIGRVVRALSAKGFTILLVEQNFRFAASIADRHYVMENGRVVDCVPTHDLKARLPALMEYLGV
jgi:branched-chain amino acid transport system ATP-binding protein